METPLKVPKNNDYQKHSASAKTRSTKRVKKAGTRRMIIQENIWHHNNNTTKRRATKSRSLVEK